MGVTSWLEGAINRVARSLEFAITGQSNFQIRLGSATKNSQPVDDLSQANIALDEVRTKLRSLFSFDFSWPILVELKQPPAKGWRGGFYNPEGNLGRYTLLDLKGFPTHQIQLMPGLARLRFCALLAHELTHAYQREKNILTSNHALREGMARWVEWHFLKLCKAPEAEKLLKLRLYTFGRSIDTLIELEKKQGRPRTVEWLMSQ